MAHVQTSILSRFLEMGSVNRAISNFEAIKMNKFICAWNTHAHLRIKNMSANSFSVGNEAVILVNDGGIEMETRQWAPKIISEGIIYARAVRAYRNSEAYGNSSASDGLEFFTEMRQYADHLNVELDIDGLKKIGRKKWADLKRGEEKRGGDPLD